ncbi:MAG: hypothetical protein JNL96_11005 [Planctomycetaceae bacterium]|nr:hypothetical protein [Planctomycetaceae bacterium]
MHFVDHNCVTRIGGFFLLCGVLIAGSGGQTRAANCGATWRSTYTKHFLIQGAFDADELQDLAVRCEELLEELRAKWFDDGAPLQWHPRCHVVVHGTLASYLREVPGGERTLGSSWIQHQSGAIVTRRIDLRGDRADWFAGALAHELIHVLLADHVGKHPPQRWAEEGLAILADPSEKQLRHDADFRDAAARGGHFRLAEMLAYHEYPDTTRITAFYGQSASLVRYLTKFRTPADFAAFLKLAASKGYDAALREHYEIDGVADLERRWLASLTEAAPNLAGEQLAGE